MLREPQHDMTYNQHLVVGQFMLMFVINYFIYTSFG